ncbi:MAG: hypothetical protein U5K77_01295 [Candidatus Saccharibacteria bacterium]|nr:hypothetical protein [Candidatus Saccharibacteria bacterium]
MPKIDTDIVHALAYSTVLLIGSRLDASRRCPLIHHEKGCEIRVSLK